MFPKMKPLRNPFIYSENIYYPVELLEFDIVM